MKIEGNRPNLENATLQRLEQAAADARARVAETRQQSSGDRVELSSDVALAGAAVKAAQEAPEIRSDLVDRMRALLDAGELGGNLESLADRLIDTMLDEKV